MKLAPARAIHGQVFLPGDKSISHRAAMISALAEGRSRLLNYARSQDCISTLNCLRQLGVPVEMDGADVFVTGRGLRSLQPPAEALDCGNSGSTMRMLAGVLAGQSFESEMTGDRSLTSRPMRRVIDPLEIMGARISSQDGKPPLGISPPGVLPNGELRPVKYELPVASAQVKSCVLLAGLHAAGETCVIEHEITRDHTERMLSWFNAPVKVNRDEISVTGGENFLARDVEVPGDVSSAAFLIAAAMLLPGSDLTLRSVGLNPTRIQFLTELQSAGAQIELANVQDKCNEPVGDIHVTAGEATHPLIVSGRLIPQLIDELPLLAVVGTQLPGGIEIRDAAELRVKESDRLATTVENLRAMGAEVEEFDDGIKVPGPQQLHGARLDSHGDHRIAMAFTVAALVAEGESTLERSECVAVSFPGFFETLEPLLER
jgi:3-phosphoshikimate 1-carboxyvinyltransferase